MLKVDKVLIPGKYEVIHSGHIRLFRMGKQLGKEIIIALDKKGLSEDEVNWRKEALLGLNLVDLIEVFEADVSKLILKIKPEIVLKGQEFANQINHESNYLESYGGKLVFSSGSAYISESDRSLEIENKFNLDLLEVGSDFAKRNGISREILRNTLSKFRNIRTCVIGDLIVDEIINCNPVGMSREEPTIVFKSINSKKFIGGAGIVAAHCEALGSKTTFITVLSEDRTANWSRTKLSELVSELIIIEDKYRDTTLKQRFKSEKQSLLKLNNFSQNLLSESIQGEILKFLEKNISKFDLLILSDFSYGVLGIDLSKKLIELARNSKIHVVADSQTSSQIGNFGKFLGSDLITPTELEARLEMRDEGSGLVVLAEELRRKLNVKNILLKLGADGVLLHGLDLNGVLLRTDQIPALNKNPLDLTGAGDSMLAASALALASGENLYLAGFLGSVMAAIQVSQISNSPISKQLIDSILSK